ncbi:MAG: MGDG synthase family glycosyltransferase [Vulcanimicrobiaceae bacterium]
MGVGHVAAARAIGAALRERNPDAEIDEVDSYEYAALVVSRIVSDGYVRMVTTVPQMYRYVYHRAERASHVGPLRAWAHQFTASNLRPLLQRLRPDAVVCTHAFPCGAMAEYQRRYADAPPVVGVVTDYALHAFWVHRSIDAYAVATPELAQQLRVLGLPPDRVAATGIPVHPRFAAAVLPQARHDLGLPLDRRVVLVMGGGLGIGPLARVLKALDDCREPICAVALVGNNEPLRRRLVRAADALGYPVRVVPFVENVETYMRVADLLVTKPGGLTLAEALVTGVPLVLVHPLPGQEERNAAVVVAAGAAVRAPRVDGVGELVSTLLRNPWRLRAMCIAAQTLAQPHAAERIADIVMNLAPHPQGVVVA